MIWPIWHRYHLRSSHINFGYENYNTVIRITALMLPFYYRPSFCLSGFPATYAGVFQKQYITLLKGGLHGSGLS